MRRFPLLRLALPSLLALAACRIETVTPGGQQCAAVTETPAGELSVYSSMYPSVVDALKSLVAERLPQVQVRWFTGGSEKVAQRLEAEVASGGVRADVVAISDPFFYERLAEEGLWMRYASPDAQRTPRSLVDLNAHFTAIRVSTMVIAFKKGLESPPQSFTELLEPRWKGQVAVGDPLTSGTSFTWAVFMDHERGADVFAQLRANEAVVAGGNAAVQQKIESGEVKAGVLLLENVLIAQEKGSDLDFVYPSDGAVTIPGYAAILQSTRNPVAARAFYDLLLSPQGQEIMRQGRMHAVDPRLPGPGDEPGLESLLQHSKPWTESLLVRGAAQGGDVKKAFSQAFAR